MVCILPILPIRIFVVEDAFAHSFTFFQALRYSTFTFSPHHTVFVTMTQAFPDVYFQKAVSRILRLAVYILPIIDRIDRALQ